MLEMEDVIDVDYGAFVAPLCRWSIVEITFKRVLINGILNLCEMKREK